MNLRVNIQCEEFLNTRKDLAPWFQVIFKEVEKICAGLRVRSFFYQDLNWVVDAANCLLKFDFGAYRSCITHTL
jgi:hypothetical protein